MRYELAQKITELTTKYLRYRSDAEQQIAEFKANDIGEVAEHGNDITNSNTNQDRVYSAATHTTSGQDEDVNEVC